jgi:glutathione S-transferase
MQLFVGNKNYSSWSMRPWVLMRQLGIEFEETALRLDFRPGSAFAQAVAAVSPAKLVPVLVDQGFSVWDTLAIVEYLHEAFPGQGVWPVERLLRARARSVSAEMHSGFAALRNHCPMNIEASLPEVGARVWAEHEALRSNVARVQSLWASALQTSGGPFLFGPFCAADAMFAPVCTRLLTYALPIDDTTRGYVQRVMATAGVQAWVKAALAERDFIDFDEPYRKQR